MAFLFKLVSSSKAAKHVEEKELNAIEAAEEGQHQEFAANTANVTQEKTDAVEQWALHRRPFASSPFHRPLAVIDVEYLSNSVLQTKYESAAAKMKVRNEDVVMIWINKADKKEVCEGHYPKSVMEHIGQFFTNGSVDYDASVDDRGDKQNVLAVLRVLIDGDDIQGSESDRLLPYCFINTKEIELRSGPVRRQQPVVASTQTPGGRLRFRRRRKCCCPLSAVCKGIKVCTTTVFVAMVVAGFFAIVAYVVVELPWSRI